MNAKAGEYRCPELRGLDVTISACYHWSVARQLIPFPLRHRNFWNVTLQTLELFSAYARLYNAAASPASHLRSAGSLAIMSSIFPFLNNRVFPSRNYWLINAPRKFDVLKTNICPRSEASRANMLVLRTSNFQGVTIRPIVLRHKHSIVFICSLLNFLPHASSKIN